MTVLSRAAARWLEALPDACMLLARDGRVLEWNAGAQAMYGYSADEARGRPAHALLAPPGQEDEPAAMLDQALQQGACAFESIRRCRDGALLYVDVTLKAVPGEAGQSPLVLAAEKDVTGLKVARDAKSMAVRYRELLESMPDGIVMVGSTGHIVLANAQAERLFGYGPGELRAISVELLLPQRYRRAHVGHRSGFFQQPRTRAMGSGLDLAGLRKDGSEFPVEISLSPLRTEEGAFVMGAVRDISERRRFERALQEKNLELAQANAAKDRFLAGMSHELRTPLNAIIGFTGTLLMRLPGPLTPEQDHQLRTVQGSARHLLSLINDLLDIAKIEAGKADVHLEAVDAAALLDEVAATLAPQAQAKGVALAVARPPRPRPLCVDRRMLRQIVLNLVGNAVKFTDAGRVDIELQQPEDADRVLVRDTGCGIAPADHPRLFCAFTRVTDAPRSFEGSGLGLHLSQKLAGALGGHIGFDSRLGEGSTFVLTLPRR